MSCLPTDDLTSIQKVLREAHIWSKLSHANVLPLMGITTDFDKTLSIVSQWMAAGNAHDYVQDKDVDPRPLIVDVARGLYYLHNHSKGPIVHGDLKGPNVLISDKGHALLTDFGYTYMQNSSLNMSVGLPRGCSPNWMSQEIAESWGTEVECPASVKSDIWAFGMTALELFTREVPFSSFKSVTSVAIRITKGPPNRPSMDSTCRRMTDDWWNACFECWKKDPSSRPPTSQLLRGIEETMVCAPFFSMRLDRFLTPVYLDLVQFLTTLSELATHVDINLDEQLDNCPDLTPRLNDAIQTLEGSLRPVGHMGRRKVIITTIPFNPQVGSENVEVFV
ncbi:hypothetical protein ID866_6912 [Astraeus odoratus]|nr:hypothetical protein ID866_6912 [Astraeus odoratus]